MGAGVPGDIPGRGGGLSSCVQQTEAGNTIFAIKEPKRVQRHGLVVSSGLVFR